MKWIKVQAFHKPHDIRWCNFDFFTNIFVEPSVLEAGSYNVVVEAKYALYLWKKFDNEKCALEWLDKEMEKIIGKRRDVD